LRGVNSLSAAQQEMQLRLGEGGSTPTQRAPALALAVTSSAQE